MFECYTFPIGDIPSNESWSGFQMLNDEKTEGFFLLFREIHNMEPNKTIQVKFLADKKVRIKNLRTGAVQEQNVDSNGNLQFSIQKKADFLFLSYQVL